MPAVILHQALVIAAIVVCATIASRVVGQVFRRMEQRDVAGSRHVRRASVYRLLADVTRYVVEFLALVIALDKVGIDTTSILAGAGVLEMEIFGAQNTVQDLVTRAFLLDEDQFQVGERILLPALTVGGTVEGWRLRTTGLGAIRGEILTVPNRLLAAVSNFTRSVVRPSGVSVALPVRLDADPAKVRSILESALGMVDRRISFAGMTDATASHEIWTLNASVSPGEAGGLSARLRERALGEPARAGLIGSRSSGGQTDGA